MRDLTSTLMAHPRATLRIPLVPVEEGSDAILVRSPGQKDRNDQAQPVLVIRINAPRVSRGLLSILTNPEPTGFLIA